MPLSENDLLKITSAPGAQYILVNEKVIILDCYAGVSDILKQTPITPETTFNNFSVTKTATAAAALLLY